jgi:hypothetical protein
MIEGSCHCGAVKWQFDGEPEGATSCNCTSCRRYGALWIYDFYDERIRVAGPTQIYIRGSQIEYHFCPKCGCICYWRSQRAHETTGRRRCAVNLRLTDEPDAIQQIPIDHFDGLVKFDDLPRDGRCVADYWF